MPLASQTNTCPSNLRTITMADYDDGWQVGYTVGGYGVRPQGGWAADGYSDPRASSDPDFREGMQHGRTDRLNQMTDAEALDYDARNSEALEAWQVYQQQTGGGDG